MPAVGAGSTQKPGALDGLRVLDLGSMMAAPYAATLLGDLGADVIKVEAHRGDDSRYLGPERDGEHTPFLAINRNKRSLLLDLRQDEARPVFERLLATTDVLITNVREPALSRLGLAYEQVKAHRDDVIWAGVTAFGPDGPYAGRPGIDFLAQGYAGMISLNGQPGSDQARVTIPVVDVMTSELVVTGVLAALLVRERTGEGQRVDVSLLDALAHAQSPGLAVWNVAGEVTPRTGNASQYFAPSGIYPTRDDSHVVITCPADKFFANLCTALEVDWHEQSRFASVNDRLANAGELDELIASHTRAFDREELVERLVAADVLTAPIKTIDEVSSDPQLRHNGMLAEVEHAKLGPVTVTGVPVKLGSTPGSVRLAPPVHGQHTRELLAELGYDAEAVEQLLSSRVAGAA